MGLFRLNDSMIDSMVDGILVRLKRIARSCPVATADKRQGSWQHTSLCGKDRRMDLSRAIFLAQEWNEIPSPEPSLAPSGAVRPPTENEGAPRNAAWISRHDGPNNCAPFVSFTLSLWTDWSLPHHVTTQAPWQQQKERRPCGNTLVFTVTQ